MRSSWDAFCWEEGWTLTWVDERPNLLSDDEELVRELYAALDGSDLPVTPTGPYIKAWPGDPLAVLVVLLRARPRSRLVLTDDAPTIPSAPEGTTA